MAKSMQKRIFDSVDTLIFNTITGTMLVTKKELDDDGNETFKIMNSETGKYESKQLDLTDDYQVINLQSPIKTDQQRSIAYYLDGGDSFSAFKEIMSRCAGINNLEEVFGSKVDDIKKLCKEQYDDKVRANENLKKSNPTVNYEYQKNLFNELSKLNIAEDLINYKCKDNPELLNEINENKSEYFSNEYLKFQNNIEKNALLRESYNFSKEEIKAYKYYNVEPNFHGVYRELFAQKPLISSVVIPLICKFIGLCSMIKHAGSPYAVEYFKKWSLLHPIGASSEKMRYIRQHKQEFLSKFDQLIKGVETDNDVSGDQKVDGVSSTDELSNDDPNLFDNLIKEYKDTANSKANKFETLKNRYNEMAQKSLETAERIINLEKKLDKTSDPAKIEKIKNNIEAEKKIKDNQTKKLKDLKEQIDKKVPEIKDLIEKNKLDVENNKDNTEITGNEDSADGDSKDNKTVEKQLDNDNVETEGDNNEKETAENEEINEETPSEEDYNNFDVSEEPKQDTEELKNQVEEQSSDVENNDDNKTENTNDNSDENEKNKNLTDIAKDIDKKSPYSNVEQDEKGVKVDELNSSKDVDFKYFISCADKTVPNHIRIKEVGGQNINLEITLKKGIEGENRLFQTLEAAKSIKYEKEIDETYFENIMGNISKGDILTINESPVEIALKDKKVTNSLLSMIEFLSEDMKNEINDIPEQNVENKVEENEEDEKTDPNEKSEDTTQDDDKPDFNDFESIEI